jgi:hypothetical protein
MGQIKTLKASIVSIDFSVRYVFSIKGTKMMKQSYVNEDGKVLSN